MHKKRRPGASFFLCIYLCFNYSALLVDGACFAGSVVLLSANTVPLIVKTIGSPTFVVTVIVFVKGL